jgi:predicted flap endonuclease-1-like 5' DNA nuclease
VNTSQIVIAAVIVIVIALVALLVLLNRRSRPAAPERKEGEGLGSGAAAAAEDVAGQFFGVEAHPDLAGPADDLTRIKGLGPKAQSTLNGLGITRYAQLAALSTAEINAVDASMGAFRGRIGRDRWIEQAGYLAAGDTASFEKIFGNLG